jgi:hypothetical protein
LPLGALTVFEFIYLSVVEQPLKARNEQFRAAKALTRIFNREISTVKRRKIETRIARIDTDF